MKTVFTLLIGAAIGGVVGAALVAGVFLNPTDDDLIDFDEQHHADTGNVIPWGEW